MVEVWVEVTHHVVKGVVCHCGIAAFTLMSLWAGIVEFALGYRVVEGQAEVTGLRLPRVCSDR